MRIPREALYANLLIGLASEALTIHGHAVRAYKERSLPYLAWATRGLFELALWTDYCTRSPDNAQRFIQDTIRDHVGLLGAIGLAERAPLCGETPDANLDDLHASLRRIASALGIEELDGKFTRVSRMADDLGMIHTYTRINTALSKFVHPTALITNTPIVDEFVEVFSNKFIQMSDVSASAVFQMIRREQKTFAG